MEDSNWQWQDEDRLLMSGLAVEYLRDEESVSYYIIKENHFTPDKQEENTTAQL